jgi:two-component system response regulator FixJ
MQPGLCIVDDDEAMRDALGALFALEGFAVACFANGAQFLANLPAQPACVIIDAQLQAPSGQEILLKLRERGFAAPIVIVSEGHDIGAAVQAIKSGAADFVEKPLDMASLVLRVREAIDSRSAQKNGTPSAIIDFPSRRKLTPREHDVLMLIAAGASNKETGRQLGISPRTVEAHRARIMEKLGARNAADLVRIVLTGKRDETKAALLGSGA